MFDTVLIANRGEIARRVIRTLDRLGVASVVVHTTADRDSPFVAEAGRTVEVGSYLDLDAIVAAAQRVGAGALHPGYGFLSENPALPRACARAGIAFVGPGADAMALMGDKLAAKAAAAQAGVPTVPGYTADEARAAPADAYPLLVKAAAGGGGRGMRVVSAPSELDGALSAASREALAGFGDDRVFIERYLPRARHLEVQVLADSHGNVIHLGERECSLQRRHQKLVEEAPSPAVGAELRAALGSEAVALAGAAGYVNAGTIEFIADAERPSEHYFLECNARLQVEHPVTELVYGVDLVELQLRVAAGDRLPMSQGDVAPRGHAIEVRVCAEDPGRGFLPTTGRVLAYDRPAHEQARLDAAIEVGSVVTADYDSLLAKVICHGPDRASALGRLHAALSRTTIAGVTTSVGFLRALLADPDVAAGRMDTGFVERHPELTVAPIDDAGIATAAAMLMLADAGADAADAGADPFAATDGWRLSGARAPSHWRMSVAGSDPVEVDVDAPTAAMAKRIGPGRFRIRDRGEWLLARDRPADWVAHGGYAWPVRSVAAVRGEAGAGDGSLRAPMPGQVLAVPATIGDRVAAGDPVIVLESMKMELTLAAPHDGTVAELTVAPGDGVAVDQPLARIEADT